MPARADPKRVAKLLAEARAESPEGRRVANSLILSGLRQSVGEPTPNDQRLSQVTLELLERGRWNSKGETEADLTRPNLADPDLWVTRALVENADASITEAEPILREAWKRMLALDEDTSDERRLAYLVVAIKRIAEQFRASASTKGLLSRIISEVEKEPNASVALEGFRTSYLDQGTTEGPPSKDETTDSAKHVSSYAPVGSEQPNPVSHKMIVPGDPTGHGGQTRPRDTSPLSEKEAMLSYLRDRSLDLDTVALRHLVRQLSMLRGDSGNE